MLTNLYLENFKRFSKANIPLGKINVFIGPNNSGKSSILGALKLLVQTMGSSDEQVPLLLNGIFGDYGTYKDVVFNNHRGRPMEIRVALDVSDPSALKSATNINAEYALSYKFNSIRREIVLEKIVVTTDKNPLVEMKYSAESGRYNLEKLGHTKIPPAYKTTISRDFRVRHFIPIPLTQRLGHSFSDRDTPVHKFSREEIDPEITRNIMRIGRKTADYFNSSDYLGPVRISPQRTYMFSGERRGRIGAAGENMTSLLMKGSVLSKAQKSSGVLEKVNDWLVKSKMGKKIEIDEISDRHYEIRIENYFTGEKQNIADVGYGHSQVLPILIGGYSLTAGSMFILEQPELHLHPKAQAELGDFFADIYESNIQTILETHSEHLILRLQQHVAEGRIKHSDINFYYIHNNPKTSKKSNYECLTHEIIPLPLDENAMFIDEWPEGFFPERLNESRKLALIRHKKLGPQIKTQERSL